MNSMTPEQALQVVSAATEPQNAARLTRQDYVNVAAALAVLEGALKELVALSKAKPSEGGK